MREPTPPSTKRRGRLFRFGAGFVVLSAVTGYLSVQYLTGGPGAPRCEVVADNDPATSYEFTPEQAVNAATIAAVGTGQGMPERAVTIALATALQESGLRNIEHGDRDSLGLFQQRPSQGWGTEKQIMDPTYAAGVFFEHLAKVPDYTQLPLTEAAQRVQRSGYPEAYAKHEPDATLLSAALTGQAAATLTCEGREDPGVQKATAAAGATAGTGADAVRAALVRDFGRDAFEVAGAQVNGKGEASPSPSPSVTADARDDTVTLPVPEGTKKDATGRGERERGWQLAHWAVANSTALHIQRVSYAGREWTAGTSDGKWRTARTGGAQGAEKSAGSVRIVTGQ